MLFNRILLSVCIPTYNRLEHITRQVKYILDENILDTCEILISNNCSTDGTYEFLESLDFKHPNFHIYHQKENIRGENFLFLIQKAQGKYVLLCGDDDYYLPGAFHNICNDLEHNELAWYFIKHNYVFTDNKITESKLTNLSGFYEKGIDLFKNIAETNGNLGEQLFISANIIRTDIVVDAIKIWKNSSEYNRNACLSLGFSFHASLRGSAYISKDVLLIDNCVNVRWKKFAGKVIYRDHLAIIDTFCKANNISLKETLDFRKYFAKASEYLYALHKIKYSYSENNYCLYWYIKNAPFYLIPDVFYFFYRIVRKLVRIVIKAS